MNNKYVKEDLEYMILTEKLSYREIGRRFGISDTMVKKIAVNLGIKLQIRTRHPEGHNKPKPRPIRYCEWCGSDDIPDHSKGFCSKKCQIESSQFSRYQYYILNGNEFKDHQIRTFKPFILKEQDCKCAICKINNSWNGQTLVLITDHIDGNADNNKRENIRLICPNCDSQLPTFKSRNKNSARKKRYLLNYKNYVDK